MLNLLGLLVALFALFPVLWMISTAFKPATEIYSLTPQPLPLHPTLANFQAVFSGSVIGMPYWNFLKNSLFITLVAVALSSLIGLLAAIALGRFKFRFRTTYLIVLLIVQLLPQQALVVSLFIDFRKLNLLDSLVGLIVVYTAFALPVTIWMLRNFAATVPTRPRGSGGDRRGRGLDALLAHPAAAHLSRAGLHQRVRVHLRLQRVRVRADLPRHRHR